MGEIRIPTFNEEFDLGLFLFITKRRLVWLILLLIAFLSASYAYLHFKRELFQASTVVQVKKTNEASRVLNVESIRELDNVAEEVELLRSEIFLQSVLKDLDLKVEHFTKGDVTVADQYGNASVAISVEVENENIYNTSIYIHRSEHEGYLSLLYNLHDTTRTEEISTGEWNKVGFGRIKATIKDEEQLDNVLSGNEYFIVINNADHLSAKYADKININLQSEAANTINISVTDYNRKKTAAIANAIAQKFTRYDLESTARSATNILEFIEQQIDTVYTRLQSMAKILRSFKNENKIRTLEELSTKYMERLDKLEDEKVSTELELSIVQELESVIRDTNSNKSVHDLLPLLAGTSFGGTISQMISRLNNMLVSREEALYSVNEINPGIKALEYQIEIQKGLLIKSIIAIKGKLEGKKSSLEAKIDEIEAVFNKSPTKEIELEQLERQYSTDEKFYTLLLEKKAEYQISKAGYVSKNIILAEAVVPGSPISPNRPLIIFAAIGLSLLIGIGIIITDYVTYNEITSLNEVSKYTRAAILGIVPKHKEKIPVSQLIVDKKPKSLISESFRSIRTNLQYISNEPGPKSIAVTSTISGEGKTFITINLGGILAYAGKKVIVLDLDLRKPKIHLGFSSVNDQGMSTLLIGKDTVDNCIRTSALPNLHFITAGPIPPNPSELIMDPRMDEVVNELKKKYDIILIDNPPVGIVTDGLTNIQKADYPIYILKANFSKRTFLKNVNKLMSENNIKKLSVILNGVNITQHGYGYGYGYGSEYGYGYGYGYGYYDDDSSRKNSIVKRLFSKKRRKAR
ncbi:MAG: polysaccharide biosynthesis tyrosine autokinase [Flavobacteriales bacterium]|nr:polysaccharide biosynthesis tyrosine autokinase [Flavobacteriales bacterium]